MKIGEIKFNFKLLGITELKDISSKLYHYEHQLSGGNVYYLENEDTNCCFAIGFRTLPHDSSGVCHIIEHSLLCGSEKYPLKEPFVNLLKTSLSTFLNAFTAYDWTMYPFASQTPKDFDNILSIYCDAVFNPISMKDPKPFLQEGWHLELLNSKDNPCYKGVVYNEMKGAMSSVDEVLVQATLDSMYRDTFYRFNSGGDPEVIPSLTYENYKKFYYEHYNPQNAMTYFYGKLDIESKLEFLDREYFSKYQKSDKLIIINPQNPFIDLSYEKEYPIGEEESEKDNTYMSLCYGLDHYDNYEELLAMQILTDALLSKNDSPVKKKLLDAKLGQNVEARIDDDNIIPALHIYLQKTNKENKKAFKDTFESAIKELVEKGIDKKLLLAQINFSEFKDKEMDMGRMPKGLIFAMNMMGSFNYRGNITSHLEFAKYYEKFKKELDHGYFENLLIKYILNSKHHVQVVLTPSKTLEKENNKKMEEKMVEIKNKMSDEEIENLISMNQELLEYQSHVDTKEELECLPSLELKDIPTTINFLDSKKIKLKKFNAFTHTLNTNKIGYTRLYFNLNSLSIEELPYVFILKNLYLNVPTNKHSALELTSLIKTYLGDLSFGLSTLSRSKDECQLYLSVSSSALDENINYIPKFINEVINQSKFPRKEVKQILNQLATLLRQEIIENGTAIAKMMAESKYSLDSFYASRCMRGPILYNFINNLIKNFNYADLKHKLKDISNRIYWEENLSISLSGNKETVSLLKKNLKKLKLSNKSYPIVLSVNFESPSKEALVISSGVSYNALTSNLSKINLNYSGKHLVLAHIVNYDYLWSEIRVKGGAYGCGLSIARNNNVSFSSYRDPNVLNTYNVFKKLPDYLKKFKVSNKEFKNYLIGTLGSFDSPLSNPAFIDLGDYYYLTKITKKEKMQLKKEVLKTKQSDLKNMAEVFENLYQFASEYSIGNHEKISEYNFEKVKSL